MSQDDVRIAPATDSLPDDVAALAGEATASGVNNVAKLIERWRNGTERYDVAGEAMLVARVSDVVVGVGGIAWCPDMPGALRVRRFYVSASQRRRGIARTLAMQLIDSAFDHTDVLSCHAGASDAAVPFWEALGFEPVEVAGITHCLARASVGA